MPIQPDILASIAVSEKTAYTTFILENWYLRSHFINLLERKVHAFKNACALATINSEKYLLEREVAHVGQPSLYTSTI